VKERSEQMTGKEMDVMGVVVNRVKGGKDGG
jgi:hypothetical protein